MTRIMQYARCLVLLALVLLAGCQRHLATPAECAEILDRIVVLELGELGFRDAALVERKAAELRRTLAPELRACEGVRIHQDSMACVRAARSAEEISHSCLR